MRKAERRKKKKTPPFLATTESERLYFHLSPNRESSETFRFFSQTGGGEGRAETQL